MKARLAIAIALGAALLAVPAALGSNSQSFPDSIGENANAPDITSVAVTNDDSANITFKINISNRPALTQDMDVLVFLNTDGSGTVGDPNAYGADYAIELDPGTVNLFQWVASANNYLAAPSQTSLTYSYDATGATIHVNASDLGNPKVIGFGVIADSGITVDANGDPDFTNAQTDIAPDLGHGFYTYNVLIKVHLTKTAFTTTPAKAGKPFAASLSATESDTGAAVASRTET